MIHDLNQPDALNGTVVTELSELPTYYKAEAYHQNYFVNHPDQGYCTFVVSPKVEKFRKTFSALIR
jgi:peptide-methionine (S)-S-oxide reductase